MAELEVCHDATLRDGLCRDQWGLPRATCHPGDTESGSGDALSRLTTAEWQRRAGSDPALPADGPDDPADPSASEQLPGSRGEHLLQCAFGTERRARRFYDDQVLDHLNPAMADFAGRMEMVFVATADGDGECDASLRSGPAGLVQVLDERHLAYPEYRGNGVMASLGNISENPHVGVLMVDFVTDLIGLHVNGRARIVDDADLRADHPQLPTDHERGRVPERWVVVSVEEAYIHCRKHIPRMAPVPRTRAWGTDDQLRKGGDFFGAKATRARSSQPAASRS